jgi:hypothetical protein
MRFSIMFFNGFTIACALCLSSSYARADSVELVNGDVINGKVVSLDDRELRLTSDIHGELSIRRDKVAAIALGERKLTRSIGAGAASGRASTSVAVPVAPGSAEDVVRQLRAQGLNVDQVGDLQKQLPLLKEPAVKKYFDDTVQGLIKGDINVGDVRKEAVRVREEYRKTAKSLGPEGEKALEQALGGYLQVLDKFIRETEPKKEEAAQQPTGPSNAAKEGAGNEQPKEPTKAKSPR